MNTRDLKILAQRVLTRTEHEDSATFALKRTTIIRSKVPTLHEAGREHRTFAKNFVHAQYERMSAEERAAAERGVGIRFIPMNIDVPIPGVESRVVQQVARWCVGLAKSINARYLLPRL